MLSCLQAIQCAPGSQHSELSPMLGWTLVISAPEVTPHPYCNLNRTHWFTRLKFDGIHTLICHGLSIWGKLMCVCHPPQKTFITQQCSWCGPSLWSKGDTGPVVYTWVHRSCKRGCAVHREDSGSWSTRDSIWKVGMNTCAGGGGTMTNQSVGVVGMEGQP